MLCTDYIIYCTIVIAQRDGVCQIDTFELPVDDVANHVATKLWATVRVVT